MRVPDGGWREWADPMLATVMAKLVFDDPIPWIAIPSWEIEGFAGEAHIRQVNSSAGYPCATVEVEVAATFAVEMGHPTVEAWWTAKADTFDEAVARLRAGLADDTDIRRRTVRAIEREEVMERRYREKRWSA